MMHTDLKVGKYWGDMGVDYWDAATWKQQVDEFEVCSIFLYVVVTVSNGAEQLLIFKT